MRDYFAKKSPALAVFLHQLRIVMDYLAPSLMSHFDGLDIDLGLFATQWILTLFSYQLPPALCFRVWDVFFIDGVSFILRMSAAVLMTFKSRLQIMGMEEVLEFFKNLSREMMAKSPSEWIEIAEGIELKGQKLAVEEEKFISRLYAEAAE